MRSRGGAGRLFWRELPVTLVSLEPGTNSSGAHVTFAPALQSSQIPWKLPEMAER